ncbi:hypothetical protein HZH66_006840 [Vespula vulgaris]|uniref:Uncharacterized protein n=1 Tax=Vespula vulgaris TaxID=7454 RepID=A0A834N957_VESVU|nr:hypothetical protein HZH66_006840 [Vespula vulgaris]
MSIEYHNSYWKSINSVTEKARVEEARNKRELMEKLGLIIKSSSISDIVIEKPVKDPSDLESWRRWEKGQNFMAAMKVIMPDGQSIRDRYLRRSISITYEFSKDQNFPGRMMQNASNIQERTSIFSRKEYVIMKSINIFSFP